MSPDTEDLLDALDSAEERSPSFADALEQLEVIANRGAVDAAEAVAEVFAFSKMHRDPAKAYFWYHVAFARRGYRTTFTNEGGNVAQYRGAAGDFRNEAPVNGLLELLGEKRIHELDLAAREWLETHPAV